MTIHFSKLEIARPAHLGDGKWKLEDLNDITVIFGKNGSGKSNLLRNIRDSISREFYHYAVPERGGDINTDMGVAMSESTFRSRLDSRQSNFSNRYRSESVSRLATLAMKIVEVTRGQTASAVNLDDIEKMIHVLLPDFNFRIKQSNGQWYELTRLGDGGPITTSSALSSGEAGILTLALDLITMGAIWELDKTEKRLLAIDEPDVHLHPDLQQHLAAFLVELKNKFNLQLVIATHSTTLLAALGHYGQTESSVLYIDNSIEEQRATPFDDALKELSVCLGGHALMGPLFATPLLLVEGDDDYRTWSQVPRHGKVKLAAIPCGGSQIEKYQPALEKVFSNLCSNPQIMGYALVDGDKPKPKPDAANKHEFVPYIQLNCREIENLYLTDEVLADLGLTWGEAKVKIKAAAPKYPDPHKTALLNCDIWDKKQEDLKTAINPLVEILDPRQIGWAIRLGRVIGKNAPTGELADFLGTEIVNAFWSQPKAAIVAQEDLEPEPLK